MEFFDLKSQYRQIKKEIDEAILNVLETGVFIGGREVEKFEKRAAEFIGTKHAIALNSGTDALYLSTKVLDIGAGDEVITTPFTFFATAEAVVACGVKPVFVDIDPQTFNIDTTKIKAAISKKTKAIIPVHLFGQMANMAPIKKIAQAHNLKIIEDCAQAMGATQVIGNCKMEAGSIGDAGCFSFFPTKNLGAYGDGGMVTTNNDEIAAEIKSLRTHGSSPENKYKNLKVGVNSRLDAIQAAVLSVKLKYLRGWNVKRVEIAKNYNQGLADIEDIILPDIGDDFSSVFHQYTIKTKRRDELKRYLKEKEIPTMIYYPTSLHLQPAFGFLNYQKGNFPETEKICKEILSLPIYPELNQESQIRVIKAIREFYEK